MEGYILSRWTTEERDGGDCKFGSFIALMQKSEDGFAREGPDAFAAAIHGRDCASYIQSC
jgi:hypothetical protein